MEKTKYLGIWMDHSSAHLMEFKNETIETVNINSTFNYQEKKETLNKSEHTMHNKEQHEQADYYKKLGEVIRNYDKVILFGPTEAKSELLNVLRADHNFEKIAIDTKQADKMTENQKHAFLKEYFSLPK